MTTERFTDQQLVRFLLGDVSDAERDAIEARVFQKDVETFIELEALEDELRFDYAQNLLSAGDRRRFEQRYLTSDTHHHRQLLVRGILNHTASEPASRTETGVEAAVAKRPWWQHPVLLPALAAAVVVLAVLSVFVARARDAAIESLAAARLEAARISGQLVAERQRVAGLEAQAAAAAVPADNLTPLALDTGATRTAGNSTPRIDAPAASRGVDLVLKLPPTATGFPSYQAVIRDADGRDVWSAGGLLAAGGVVHAKVPPAMLIRADYEVVLRGAVPGGAPQDLASYYFRVVAR